MASRNDKALFNRKILNQAVSQFAFPTDFVGRHQKILAWVESLEAGTLCTKLRTKSCLRRSQL